MTDDIVTEHAGSVLRIQLNRPTKRNAMTSAMYVALAGILNEAANDIIVPLNGAGGKLTSTISSPLQVHGVTKVPAKRAPKIGEHNEEVLRQLGFSAAEIDGLRASGAIPKAKEDAA